MRKSVIIILLIYLCHEPRLFAQDRVIVIEYQNNIFSKKSFKTKIDSVMPVLSVLLNKKKSIVLKEYMDNRLNGYNIVINRKFIEVQYFLNDTLNGEYLFINRRKGTLDKGYWLNGIPVFSWFKTGYSVSNESNAFNYRLFSDYAFYDSIGIRQGLFYNQLNTHGKWPVLDFKFYIQNEQCLHFEGSWDSIRAFIITAVSANKIADNANLFEYIRENPSYYQDAQYVMSTNLQNKDEERIRYLTNNRYKSKEWELIINVILDSE